MSELEKVLSEIQTTLSVPKKHKNKFGGYNYRNCEDIVEAVKPLLNGAILTIKDDLIMIGDRYYIKATAMISIGEQTISATGWAREEENKKGMDASQLTGSTSSYARKYALNGLFAIDDTKDADGINKHNKDDGNTPETSTQPHSDTKDVAFDNLLRDIHNADSLVKLKEIYDHAFPMLKGEQQATLIREKDKKKQELEKAKKC